ncbi:MAG: ORF2 [Tettorquevirus sp.]|nr:MAG: ORF2 [Tettorquevirus sp.]
MGPLDQEAAWFESVRYSHSLWCPCLDYRSHFLPKEQWGDTGGPTDRDLLDVAVDFTVTPPEDEDTTPAGDG